MIEYHTHFLPTDFIIIGCGGTGSRLTPLVAQFLASADFLPVKRLILVDFDTVEEKNLERQNFTRGDIGVNKAEALGRRYGRHFGLDYLTIQERITNENLSNINVNSAVVFCCVDTMDARRQILNVLGSYFNLGQNSQGRRLECFFIDAGNEDTFGQVKVSTLDFVPSVSEDRAKEYLAEVSQIPAIIQKPLVINQIPLDDAFYRIPNSEVTTSCAERDQTLAINTLMAATQFAFFQDFMYHKPLTTFEVRCSTQGGGWVPVTFKGMLDYQAKKICPGASQASAHPGEFGLVVTADDKVHLSDWVYLIIKDNPVPKPAKPKKKAVKVTETPEVTGATEATEAPATAPTPDAPALTMEMLAAAVAGARRL